MSKDATTQQRRDAIARHENGLHTRAAIADGSINVEKRTCEVTFGSQIPTPMWIAGERSIEILSFNEAHIRLGFLNSGANVLDNHNQYGSVTDTIVGVIERAWTDGNQGYCKIRFSKSEAGNKVWDMVKDGMCRWVSVGYRIFAYQEEISVNALPTYTAIDWEPLEVSFVPVPADTIAGVRSEGPKTGEQLSTVQIFNQQRNMEDEQNVVTTPAAVVTDAPAPAANPAPPAVPILVAEGGQRAAQPVTAAAPATANAAIEILRASRAAGIDQEFAEGLIAEGLTADQGRARIIEEWQQRGATPAVNGQQTARVAGEAEEVRLRHAIEGALVHRIDPAVALPDNGARAFAGLNFVEMSREYLRKRGVKVENYSRREICEIALGTRAGGMMSTSDFPLILGNTVNRTLRAAYELAPRTFMPFSQRTTAADFRLKTAVQLGEASAFDKVYEGGEYKRGKFSEAAESYRVEKFGKIFPFTWEMMVNDDLSAFTRVPRAIAAQAAQKQSDVVWPLLITGSGQTMADGVALFHASHGNLAGSGTAITVASLAAARAAMRKQKGLDGTSFLNLMPEFLIVGPDKELEAYQFTSTMYVPATSGAINVPYNTNLKVIVEPRITGNAWFLATSPSALDTLEYAFLEGEGELFTDQRVGFDVDGIEFKARMVFGAKVLDIAHFYKNPGA